MSFLSNIFGDDNTAFIKRAFKVVEKINLLEPEFKKLSDEELKNKTTEFKTLLASGQTLDTILPQAFAAVREASTRTLGQRHFDVQLIGGMVLHEGKVAEMRTGEGKTLTATLAIYLNALEGRGAHVVTVNDYLARRDAVWMGQIYNALGLSVGCINHDSSYIYDSSHITNSKLQNPNDKQITNSKLEITNKDKDEVRDILGGFKVVHEFLRPCSRREAYRADITYGTNNEYGFDYLRDNLVYNATELSQRSREEGGWNFAIVDEVDSILIDEARTPLIISQPDMESGALYDKFAKIIPKLNPKEHYTVDEKHRAVVLTQEGISKVEEYLAVGNIYEEGSVKLVHHLEQALKAQVLFKRDKDYIIKNGEVIIVDEFTGRLMPGRRYSEGLHQAIEAKEGVAVKRESRTVATITFQNYFRQYKKIAGMSGTAKTSEEEFRKVYRLDAVVVPTHKTMIRADHEDVIYKTEKGKFQAVLRRVKELNDKGQPVLLGTGSIEKNEYLGVLLGQIGVPHKVLNAKNHELEAQIIAQAGRIGAVTLATNIAGRGVDIVLGGNPADAEEAKKVKELGGLFVLGTERHEARRIDNQLRGRAGRQGDTGESQFFVSLEDELMRVFGGDKIKNLMTRFNIPEDEAIRSGLVSKAIESAQTKIEGYHFDVRHHVLEYDEVMNKHREVVYKLRRELINENWQEKVRAKVLEIINGEVERVVLANISAQTGIFDISGIIKDLNYIISLDEKKSAIESETDAIKNNQEKLVSYFQELLGGAYQERENNLGSEAVRQTEKVVLLRTIDELWMTHLSEMEYLRDSVGLRAYGQRDPLVEYKTEGHRLFQDFLGALDNQVSSLIFKVGLVQQPFPVQQKISYNKQETANLTPQSSGDKVGRNDPCPCGSGKKYKKCHGA